MCVYNKLSNDKVPNPSLPSLPLSLALTPSPTLYLCSHASLPLIFLPWETRKPSSLTCYPPPPPPSANAQQHSSLHACTLQSKECFMTNSAYINVIWHGSNELKQDNHIGSFTVQKMHTHHIYDRFNNTHPHWRLLLLAAGQPCFDVVWCIDRSAARSWMTSSRDQKEWARTTLTRHLCACTVI